jgi:hypothetical protein
MKQIYRITLFTFLTVVSVHVNAQTNYTLTDDDVVVVDGVITSNSYDDSQGSYLTIPDTLDGQAVIGIKDISVSSMGVFKGAGIERLTLPSTIQTIGGYAFYYNDIDSVDFSACKALVSIEDNAFKENSIDNLDLSGCTALESLSGYAFSKSGVKSVNFSGCTSLTSIGSYCFNDCSVNAVDFTGCIALEYIGGFSFKDASIVNLDLSPCTALRSISSYAFESGTLESIDLSGCSTLTSIGGYAFISNNIKTLDLSGCTSLASIGNSAFNGNAIDTIDLSLNTALVSIGTSVFSNNTFSTYALPSPNISGLNFNGWLASTDTTFIGGDTVSTATSISYEAQFGPYTLTDDDVVVVDGVIISCNKTKFNCELTIPEVLDNQIIIGIGNEDEGSYVFYAKGIKAVSLPSTLQTIGYYAFASNDLDSLDLTHCTKLTSIGERSFEKNDITNLDLSKCNLLTTIERSAFYYNNIVGLNLNGCSLLTNIHGWAFASNDIDILDLSSCIALKIIGSYTFHGNNIDTLDLSYCSLLDSLGSYAFQYNDLDTIDLSTSKALTYIGYNAFTGNNFSSFALPTPDVVGYTFNHWIDTDDSTYIGGEVVSEFSITYKASMSANEYELVYEVNGGKGYMPNDTLLFNETVMLDSNLFSYANYSFIGWNTAANGSGTAYTDTAEYTMTVEGDTLYAQWIANEYLLVFNANGGDGAMTNQPIAFNDTVNLNLNLFTKVGYSFTGWNIVKDGSGTAYADEAEYTMLTEGDTLYAQWTINEYDLVFDANGGEGTMANQTIAFNTTVTINANAFTKTDYSFGGWNTVADGSGTTFANEADFVMNVEGDTLYAQWNMVSGINPSSTNNFTIYPNPTSNFITVNNIASGSEINIYNTTGRLVKHVITVNQQEIINVSEFYAGIYIVSVNSEKQKLIVE